GDELAKIQERKLSVRDKMHIDCGGTSATVHKAMLGIRDRYTIDPDDGPDMHAHGNFVDHECEIERDGDTIATISKKWFRVRDTYGVEIGAGEDQAFILSITVCVDEMARG
ncbi:MAG TPA: LURP-one-related family protein, partial [Nakamurella sp.]|nr:LURP-one-related family protein [Nakamurella sp.]